MFSNENGSSPNDTSEVNNKNKIKWKNNTVKARNVKINKRGEGSLCCKWRRRGWKKGFPVHTTRWRRRNPLMTWRWVSLTQWFHVLVATGSGLRVWRWWVAELWRVRRGTRKGEESMRRRRQGPFPTVSHGSTQRRRFHMLMVRIERCYRGY